MPNLWTNTTQKVYEVFYGPRTRDTEFDIKVDEMKMHEKSFLGIKAILSNFQKNTLGIKYMCRDAYTNLSSTYGDNSPYSNLINEMCNIHKEIEKLYDIMEEQIRNIAASTSQWDKYFEEARANLITRDNYRRTYDHYDEKMEKLVKIRNEKLYRGIQETPKEIEKFDRNDEKYKKATDDFVKQSGYTFNLICELIDFKYKMLNPAVVGFVNEERKFFVAVSALFKKYENFEFQMKSLDSNIRKSGTDYNPSKYVRGYKLLQGVNVNDLPSVQNSKKNEKYSYEEYLKSKNPNQNVGNLGNVNSVANFSQPNPRNENSPNKYSYEQYKAKKQLNKSNDNLFSLDDNKSSGAPNKINLNNNTPPTSSYLNNNQNPHSFLNFELTTKPGINQTTILSPIEGNQQGEQIKEAFNPYSLLTFDMTPQQQKANYGGSYLPSNNNINRGSMNINQQQPTNMNYSNIPGRNFNMPNYNNGYGPNNLNMNNPGNPNNPYNFNNNNPGNLKFPK